MWIAALMVLVFALAWPARGRRRRGSAPCQHTGPQWRRAYGRRSFLRLGFALGAAAVLVYSGADEAIEREHTKLVDPREGRLDAERKQLRAAGREVEADALKVEDFAAAAGDRVAQVAKPAGERAWFLVWGLTSLGDWLWQTSPVSRWGRANFEAMCVGLPMLWTMQRVLGANRPSSRDGSPRWRPFQHANAASGHAFIGAIPWWTLALRVQPVWARGAARALGLLTGWSRLNDRKHYASQVLLGWTVAWNAVEATRSDAATAVEEES